MAASEKPVAPVPRRRRWIFVAAACLALLAGAVAVGTMLLAGRGDTGQAAAGKASIGGPFELVDQDGRTVTDRDYRGRLMLVYFGYSWCPDVCPMDLQTLATALDGLGPEAAEQVAFLFVSVDPRRDTPERLKDYVAALHPRLEGLTGSPEQVDRAAKAYRVYYRRHDAGGGDDYPVDHSAFAYLMGRDGAYLAAIGHGASPENVAQAIRAHL